MQAKYYLDTLNKEGKCRIYVRFIIDGKPVKHFFNSIPKVKPKDWDKATKLVKKSFEGFSDFNARFGKIKSNIENAILKYQNAYEKNPDKDALVKLLYKVIEGKEFLTQTDINKSFWGYINDFIHRSQIGVRKTDKGQSIAPSTIKTYITLKHILKDYEVKNKVTLTFEAIDNVFFDKFLDYLQATKKYKMNTIYKHIRNLKTFMRESFENEVHTNMKFASKKFSAKTETTTAIYLNEMELLEIYKLNLTDKPSYERVRDLFIIGCHTGLRFSDLHQIIKSNITIDADGDTFLQIDQTKTGKPVIIPLSDVVLEIIKKYNSELPPPISSQKSNAYIKEICKDLPSQTKMEKIEYTKEGKKQSELIERYKLISSHTARRSFATNSLKLGHNVTDIMAITGHSTEKNFYKYIRSKPIDKAKQFKLRDRELRMQNIN